MEQLATLIEELKKTAPTLELRAGELMSKHTSFRIGGPAALMATPKTEDEAQAAMAAAYAAGVRPLLVGNGTNLLVADEGLDNFVIKPMDGLNRLELTGEGEITAGSGVLLSRLASFALECGLTGLEFAHGIPGSVGGAVTMNAGAYGGELGQVVTATRHITAEGAVKTLHGAEHAFAYRYSTYCTGERLVCEAVFSLRCGDRATIKAQMEELAGKRRAKQPLEYPSAGSTFKRPEGRFAGALIEQCGLKGAVVGGAQVSEKHGGFIINRGGATCGDVLGLMELVRETVLRQTGIVLEPEVKVLR